MLRRLPTSRLLALIAVVVTALGAGAAIAVAALGGSGPKPPAKPLDVAVRDALTAPPVEGVTARVRFTNRLVSSSSLGGGSTPLLSGASGRLWASADGRLRLELQSEGGDVQVAAGGHTVTVVDGTQNQAYRVLLPSAPASGSSGDRAGAAPTLAQIDRALTRLARGAAISGAIPSHVAGRPAYTVRLAPKHDGGLVGAAELAWDAANGTPLRAAVYAAGDPDPVLELEATDIGFGAVPAADLRAPVPPGTAVTTVDLRHARPAGGARSGEAPPAQSADPRAVARQLPFALSAPTSLAGRARRGVVAVGHGADRGALVTYGSGLGGIAVLEQAARPDAGGAAPSGQGAGGEQALQIPTVSIDGTPAQQLATALGTVLRFARGGVQYTVIGSVPAATARAAARGL